MPQPVQGRFRRLVLRLVRLALGLVLGLTLLAGLTLGYLRWSGVPGFVRDAIENRLRASGWNVRFSKLRLHGRILIGDRVNITRNEPGLQTSLDADRAEFTLRQNVWQAGVLLPSRVRLFNAQLAAHSILSNAPPRQISLDQIQMEIELGPADQIDVRKFTGRFLGMDVQVTASLTNISAFRQWRSPATKAAVPDWGGSVEKWIRELETVRVAHPATLEFSFSGDGKDPASLRAGLRVQTPQLASSLGVLQNVELRGAGTASRTTPSTFDWEVEARLDRFAARQLDMSGVHCASHGALLLTNATLQRMASVIQAQSARTPWTTNGPSTLAVGITAAPGGAWRTGVTLHASEVTTSWAQSRTNALIIDWTHDASDWTSGSGEWKLETGPVHTPWGEVERADLAGSVTPAWMNGQWCRAEESWGAWSKLEPYHIDWEIRLESVRSPKLRVERASCTGQWRAPELVIERLRAELYNGRLESAASVDVGTRDLRTQTVLDFDLTQLAAFLSPEAQQFCAQFAWSEPPEVAVDARLILPAWTSERPRWREATFSSLQLAGEVSATNASVRGLPIHYAHSRFSLTNGVWQLPDLLIRRPDGETSIACAVDTRREEFHIVLDGGVNPKALQPLLADPEARKPFDLFTFPGRPLIQAEARGNWRDLQSIQVQARVVATNFTFKGEPCDHLSAKLLFTNKLLYFSDTLVRQGTQQIHAPAGVYDIPQRVVYVTNAVTDMDPDLVVRVIGPKVRAAIKPYRFLSPPHVIVNGRIPTVDEKDADVHFKVKGDKFNYWRINLSSVAGDVFWRGERLNITNIQATAYGGTATWHGEFDFTVPNGAQLKMDGYVRNADLHDLMTDLTKATNQLAGKLTGRVNISDANSEDWQSWQGAGWVRLRDGYLWEIPIFGIFSPVLNAIVPGLGHSPVSSGNATFTVNRSVVKTKNLEVRSPALRLRYNGTVNFSGAVEARVQAEVLRDAWAVGRVLSFAFWPITKAFEYRIHGTVNQPKSEPLYIPKLLLWPLHPFRNTRQFFEGGRQEPPELEPEPDSEPEGEPAEK